MASIASSVDAPPTSVADDSKAPSPRPSPCLLTMREHLLGQFEIGDRSRRAQIIEHDRLAVTRCLSEADVPRNDRGQDLAAEMLLDLGLDLGRQTRPAVEHRQHDALHVKGWVQLVPHEPDGLED